MKKNLSVIDRIIKQLASLRLAVFVILALAIVAAAGTFTEAHYNDAEMASKLVYQSPWMYGVLGMLIITLTAVMIDRWPWRRHHTPFVLAHIGIITLLFGAWLTQQYGVDGTVAFEIGQQSHTITVKDRDFMVWGSMDGTSMRPLFEQPVDFIGHPPTPKNPLVVNLGNDQLRVMEHLPYAFRESEINSTENAADTPAIRFQLQNANVNMTQWLRRERGRDQSQMDLGPAKIVLAQQLPPPSGRNEVIIVPHEKDAKLDYVIYNKDKTLRKKGSMQQAETIDTGWMGLQFRLLRYLPHAVEVVHYVPAAYSTPMTTSALRLEFNGKEQWAGLDTPIKLYLSDRVYVVVYGHRQIPLVFPMRLKEFHMGKYQGTQRASSYASTVEVPGRGDVVISMNEPLKQSGYTFYQSSFEQNEQGEPTVSILSVNYDPGRWVKYLGSFLIVFGSSMLFWFRRVKWFRPGGAK